MSGSRILLGVLFAAVVLAWLAFGGARDADLERGVTGTDEAFAHVEAELGALDPSYQVLRAQGLVLGLREQRDRIVTRLAELRSRRVGILEDPGLDRRERLPRLLELVEQVDELLALALDLHRTCDALVAFRRDLDPLLEQAREGRDGLAALATLAAPLAARRTALAGRLAELDQRAAITDRLLRQNLEQGRTMAGSLASDLRTLLDEQAALRRDAAP